jgi:hypothetical protein
MAPISDNRLPQEIVEFSLVNRDCTVRVTRVGNPEGRVQRDWRRQFRLFRPVKRPSFETGRRRSVF